MRRANALCSFVEHAGSSWRLALDNAHRVRLRAGRQMPIAPLRSTIGGSRSIGVAEVLTFYDQMAVPHFQRGLVWGQSSVALLLESLYFGTPCGSIILWTPGDVSKQGVALSKQKPRYLIVDGQQRLRSLHAVFAASKGDLTVSASDIDGPEVDPAADAHETNRPDIWCLNLARLPEFNSDPQFAGGRRFRLFRRVPDPRLASADIGPALTGALKQERDALVPLGWLLELIGTDHKADLLDDPANQRVIAAAERVLGEALVVRRLAEMRKNEVLHVSILDDTRDLADVVSIYARINTSGRPVEAEERAFAALVATCTETNEALRRFFVAVHPERMNEPSSGLVRDKLEQRERENKFGFKLFMRVFTIAFAYHCDRVRSTDLAFDAINADVLDKAAKSLQAILDITVEVLIRLANVIRAGSLYCDDLRFLPDTSSLWPLIQLMVTFPTLLAADPSESAKPQVPEQRSNLSTSVRGLTVLSGRSEKGPKSSPLWADTPWCFTGCCAAEARETSRTNSRD
jgi:hypothetical protein